jgi:hypothetical protein
VDYSSASGSQSVGGQHWNNEGLASGQGGWQNNEGFAIGWWRTASGSNVFSVNSGSNLWAAKSADDGNKASGTLHPYGNAGYIGAYALSQDTQVYVHEAGSWVQRFVAVQRSAAWQEWTQIYVHRGGSWVPVNEYVRTHEIGEKGVPARIVTPLYWEDAWLVEPGSVSWFGSVNPTKLGIPWNQIGQFEAPIPDKAWIPGGVGNSNETQEEIERRAVRDGRLALPRSMTVGQRIFP